MSVTCCGVGGDVGDGVGGTVSFEMALMRGAAASDVGDGFVGDGIGDGCRQGWRWETALGNRSKTELASW